MDAFCILAKSNFLKSVSEQDLIKTTDFGVLYQIKRKAIGDFANRFFFEKKNFAIFAHL